MTSDDRRQRDIERNEQWLRAQCADDTPPSLERIKAGVRLAVSEAWLARTVEDEALAGLVDRSKATVRTELTQRGDGATSARPRVSPSGSRSRTHWFGWIGGLTTVAAAACVAIMIGVQPNRASGKEMSYVEAFVSFDDDDLTASLRRLGEEFDAMESVADDLELRDDDGFEGLAGSEGPDRVEGVEGTEDLDGANRADMDGDEPLPRKDDDGDGDSSPRERS